GERREVERELQRTLPPDDEQRETRPEQHGEQQLAGRCGIETEHERELAEREAVRFAPEVDVDRKRLGQEEGECEAPPGDGERVRRPETGEDGVVEDGGSRGRGCDQPRYTKP